MEKMKAAIMVEPGNIQIIELKKPIIKDNEILVKVKHIGLCGSDVHYFQHGRIGDFIVEKPIILGHECAGEVVALGGNVKSLVIGDLVALEPGIPCGLCNSCKSGKYNLCPDVVFLATPPHDGAFLEYLAYPEHMAFKLPEGVDTVEGALIEPLAVGFHAALQAGARVGGSAVILGAGGIGLCTAMALKSMGVTDIIAVDLVEKRLDIAKKIGAKATLNAAQPDLIESIMKLTAFEGADYVFETAGSKAATQLSAEIVKRGGTIVLVGMAPEAQVPYDFGKLIAKEAQIKTVFRYRNMYPLAIKATASHLFDLKSIVTDTFKLDDVQQAVLHNIENKRDVVKIIIEV